MFEMAAYFRRQKMRRYLPVVLLACCLVLAALICGCCVHWGWHKQEHFERTETLSASMAGLEQIKIDTSFGDVKITGSDTTQCSATAKINAQAPTIEEARQLAEQTKIILVPEGTVLVFRIEKPHLGHNRSVGVAYEVTIPTKTAIKCDTSFGKVDLKNITGNIDAKTSFGKISLKNIVGDIDAKTSFGKISADNITGKIRLDTSFGEVDCEAINTPDFQAKSSHGKMNINFSDACPADLHARIETSFGEVDVDVPSNFAGDLVAETSFGSVKTDMPITIKGEVGRTGLKGTIGEGKGSIVLKTSFGAIKIK